MTLGRKIILVSLIFVLSAVFLSGPMTVSAQSEVGREPVIERSWFTQAVDWVSNTWQKVVNWVIEQGTHLARAFFSQRLTPSNDGTQAPEPVEPQVLGEETTPPEAIASPSAPHPTPLLREERESESVPVAEPVPVETEPLPATEPAPVSEPASIEEQQPIPAEIVVPPTPEPAPAPIPSPESTPEILSAPPAEEPTRPSGPFFIPILARDFVAPTSAVSSLVGTMENAAFTVSWTGQDVDVTATPEVKSYDIQYQVDSGAWTDWLLETVLLSSSFTGENAKTYGFRSRARDRYGNLEEYPSSADASTYMELTPSYEVIINEIAWMGTQAGSNHEWIELYNPGNSTVDLINWTLKSQDGTPNITIESGKTIASKSYFLLERAEAASNVASDQIYSDELGDGGELLVLRNSSGRLVDKAGSSSLAWFAGDNSSAANRATMERKNPTTDGTSSSNWATNDGSFINGQDNGANNIKGTPKSLNSQNTTIPRSITDLQMQFIYTTTTSVRLYWTTPKTANLATTTPASYDIRYLASGSCPITDSNWATATQATGEPTPSSTQGAVATSTVSSLTSNTEYCFALKTNNGSNDSGLSNVYYATTEDGNYTTLAGYPVSGVIASSSSPYLITADISIPDSSSLTIQSGAVVKMSGVRNITLGANSTLVIGSASDSINAAVITSKDDNTYSTPASGSTGTPAAGDWNRITMSSGTLTANNAIIRYGGNSANMVQATGGTLTMSRSILEYSNNNVMAIQNDSTSLTLSNSTIRGAALLSTPAGLDGLGVSTNANINITGTTFTGNRRGIAIDTNADEANITISGNNFFANNRVAVGDPNAGIHVSDTDGTTVVAQNNWWGSASGPTLDTHSTADDRDGALDNNDGSLSATNLDISNFATSAFSILPNNL